MFAQRKLKNIEVKLSLSADQDTDKETFLILFSVHNYSNKEKKICQYMTPFEGFKANFLTVLNHKGEEMEYKGIMVKRSQPKNKDFIKINSKAKAEICFDLFQAYQITEKGKYTLQFIGNPYLNKLPDSNVLEFVIE